MFEGVFMARLDKTLRYRVVDAIPPKQCKATSKRAQRRCLRPAMVGADVCQIHGGLAPQVRAKAEERVTLAERLITAPKRQTWDVLEDVAHIFDVLLQDALEAIRQGTFTVQALEKLIAAADRAHRVSTSNHHAGLAERKQRFAEGQAQLMHRFVMAVLNGIGITPEQRALVPAVIKREIEGVLVPPRDEIAA